MSNNIDALRAVLADQPTNHQVRRVVADLCVEAGRNDEAVEDFRLLHAAGQLDAQDRADAANLALSLGLVPVAQELLRESPGSQAPAPASPTPSGPTPSSPAPENDIERSAHDQAAHADEPLYVPTDFTAEYGTEPERDGPSEVRGADFIDPTSGMTTFSDVGGLTDVKKVIERLIIQPLERPELFEKYGKRPGGGVLLYGPPGCGKTLIAKATAGQAGLPFYNLRIEDLVDPYYGVTERRLAGAFEAARELQPCILFIDELDALGFARSQSNSDRGRAVVEVLLQQLDSIGNDNTGLLVLAASNEPWDIDGALLRPGRFDRTIFVPPPDEQARSAILSSAIGQVPNQSIDLRRAVKATQLFSGADLRELVDRALEEILDEAMRTNTEPPLTQAQIDLALAQVKPTTITWLNRARNHADFGNIGGRWDDVQAFLKKRAVAKQLRLEDPNR